MQETNESNQLSSLTCAVIFSSFAESSYLSTNHLYLDKHVLDDHLFKTEESRVSSIYASRNYLRMVHEIDDTFVFPVLNLRLVTDEHSSRLNPKLGFLT